MAGLEGGGACILTAACLEAGGGCKVGITLPEFTFIWETKSEIIIILTKVYKHKHKSARFCKFQECIWQVSINLAKKGKSCAFSPAVGGYDAADVSW